MGFKTPVCQVVCLVLTVILRAATAQNGSISIEALVNNTMVILEQKIMETLQRQHKEVIDTLAGHATNVQRMAESVKHLRNTTDTLLAGQLDIHQQLTKMQNTMNLFPSTCATLDINATGTYAIRPAGAVEPFLVLCDIEDNFNFGGGWTVFQRRINGTVDFYQNWTMYKNGFGDVNGEHWLGLEKLHVMTRSGRHELLIILEDHDAHYSYALYDNFVIGSEAQKYQLFFGSYSGTAGDSLRPHNGVKFSTFDQDNDPVKVQCATKYRGGWWFHGCLYSHLNGVYHKKGEHLTIGDEGVKWDGWKGEKYSLKSTKMMLRRHYG